MKIDHLKKVEAISKEVKELHPLLLRLLKRLPQIQSVEYTQGNTEMGADFVLQKHDPPLNDIVYIGVIAKLGQIKQNHQELKRQIEECAVKRYFDAGRKEIFLSEIWVISTGTITQNAQRTIAQQYPARAVKFIDSAKLAVLIEQHLPNYWDDLPIELSTYFMDLTSRMDLYEGNASLGLAVTDSFYVELEVDRVPEHSLPATAGRRIYSSKKGRRRKPRSSKTVDLKKLISERASPLLIEGEMGSGKSKLIRELIRHFASSLQFERHNLVPVYTSCSALVKDHGSDMGKCIQAGLKSLDLASFENEPAVLLFIDGVDEVLGDEDRHSKMVGDLIDKAHSLENAVVVLTTRPLVSLKSSVKSVKGVEKLRLKPLSFKKITEFIERICNSSELSGRIVEDIQKSQLFRSLPQCPIAAILLSRLIKETGQDLPRSMSELYAKAMELMLGRWDEEKLLSSSNEYEAAVEICGELAEYMLENDLTVIAESEARRFADGYLKPRHLQLQANAVFDKIRDRSGVLIYDPIGGTVAFRHRSFAEFLYAKRRLKDSSLPVDWRYFNSFWASACFFYVGLRKDCPALLREILAFPVDGMAERLMKVLHAPQYLLAAITTPYDVTEDNLASLLVEAAEVYLELRSDPKTYKVDSLSEMELLWLVSTMLRHQYSYEFFKEALDGAAVEVIDSLHPRETKLFASFFAGLIGLDLNHSTVFDLLLTTYKRAELPISLSVAIGCEVDGSQHQVISTLMRRHEKMLRKSVRNNTAIRKSIEDVFDTPLSARRLTA